MIKYRCPECGSEEYLYVRADARWNPETGSWETCFIEDECDCTECDWAGPMSKAEATR